MIGATRFPIYYILPVVFRHSDKTFPNKIMYILHPILMTAKISITKQKESIVGLES